MEYYLYHFYKEEFTYYFIGAKRNLKIDLSNLDLFVYIDKALIFFKTVFDTKPILFSFMNTKFLDMIIVVNVWSIYKLSIHQ